MLLLLYDYIDVTQFDITYLFSIYVGF